MGKKMAKNAGEEKNIGFEEALARLETIVGELEEGQIGLEEALRRYEQGVKLLRKCYNLLERAERRIEMLSGIDAEGNPITTPVEDPEWSLEEKAQQRSRRRSTSADQGDIPEKR